jgi:hypothetical protein
MKKVLTLIAAGIIGYILGDYITDYILEKKSVDEVVDNPEYLTHEDYENAVNIDVPLV